MGHPCLSCGACCAFFRVAFHWSESDHFPSGMTPSSLTEKFELHRLVMRGTQAYAPRCIALHGVVGEQAHCGIYRFRPSPCHDLQPAWESGLPSSQCDRARLAHGLTPLSPESWIIAAQATDAEKPEGFPTIPVGAEQIQMIDAAANLAG